MWLVTTYKSMGRYFPNLNSIRNCAAAISIRGGRQILISLFLNILFISVTAITENTVSAHT